ncbi:hypothetical protein HO173_008460 [Letharia columbiana]|uniref:Uncharacterized protein n=1 Tax=Letharia columbiana TaxID=112416 RepID=A0A8H6L2P6_9LECA|nr:uncharacterized protein HO173_008460 [Letharia columbiana]KAF6233336.1 hypothetical protein HO173_008460 [Letharia columbiana]
MLPTTIFISLSLSALLTLTSAASPTSFCKCTCFTNSTIIPLDAPISTSPRIMHNALLLPRAPDDPDDAQDRIPDDPPADDAPPETLPDGDGGKGKGKGEEGDDDRKEYRAGNCNDCNRQFCLDYNLPICKGAGMEDVFTTCFQRDSRKDEAVVFIFIIATAALLIWAAIKPWVAKWVDSARERRSYIPVSSQGDS